MTFHITPPVMKATDRDAYLDSYTLSTETTFNYKGESDTQTKTSNIFHICCTHIRYFYFYNAFFICCVDFLRVYDIVTNKEIIALNQDLPLLQCKRISTANGMDILVKPLQNQETGEAEVAVCFFNKTGGNNSSASVDLKELAAQDARLADLGWDGTELYRVKNLYISGSKHITG